MTTPNSANPAWRIWASERLGVPAEASATDAGIAFLGSLEAADFAPPADLRIALKLRNTEERPGPQQALTAFEKHQAQTLRALVEDFAKRYWSVPPAERQAEHARLVAAAHDAPIVRLRLEGLREALTVEKMTVCDDNPARVLAKKIQDDFVLPPFERAVRQQQLLDALQSDPDGAIALQGVVDDYAEIARLAGRLEPRILQHGAKRNYLELRKSKLFTSSQATMYQQAASAEGQSRPYQSSLQIGFVILGIAFGIFRVISSSGSHHPPVRYDFTPPTTFNPLQNLQLKIVTHKDGTIAVEAFDKEGKQVQVGEATKRLLGSKELLESKLLKNPDADAAKKKAASRQDSTPVEPRIP
jgi:hypothetical protein